MQIHKQKGKKYNTVHLPKKKNVSDWQIIIKDKT